MTETLVDGGQVDTEVAAPVADAGAAAPEAGKATADAAAPAPVKADPPKPLADGGEAKSDSDVKPTWPEDWREQLAAGDEAFLKQLRRYKSPQAYARAGFEAQQRIRSGEMKAALPENPTDAQLAEWRKENGIPEKPGDYLAELPDGLVVGDADKPVMQAFAEKMHGLNAPPSVVKEAVAWYFAERENQMAAQAEADKAFQAKAEDELRAEWGAEYRVHQNAVKNYISTLPEEVGATLLAARGADGYRLGDNPHVVRWLANLVSELNPAATVMPGSMNDPKSLDAEIARLEGLMRTDRKAYNKEEGRYRELLDARDRMNARR